ncbi:MAG: hypothetical protein QM785_17050 [Pyrinomonadaceae bacterium]
MTRKILSVSLPPPVEKWVRNHVKISKEFDSVSDYIRVLIKNDRNRLRNKAQIGPMFDSPLVPGSIFTRRLK